MAKLQRELPFSDLRPYVLVHRQVVGADKLPCPLPRGGTCVPQSPAAMTPASQLRFPSRDPFCCIMDPGYLICFNYSLQVVIPPQYRPLSFIIAQFISDILLISAPAERGRHLSPQLVTKCLYWLRLNKVFMVLRGDQCPVAPSRGCHIAETAGKGIEESGKGRLYSWANCNRV